MSVNSLRLEQNLIKIKSDSHRQGLPCKSVRSVCEQCEMGPFTAPSLRPSEGPCLSEDVRPLHGSWQIDPHKNNPRPQ